MATPTQSAGPDAARRWLLPLGCCLLLSLAAAGLAALALIAWLVLGASWEVEWEHEGPEPSVPCTLVREPVEDAGDGTLWALTSSCAMGFLGTSLAVLDDLTGDGCDELAVGAYNPIGWHPWTRFNPEGPVRPGAVYVLDGADGRLLRTIAAEGADRAFGQELATIGDVDGDGRRDLAIAAADWSLKRILLAGFFVRSFVHVDSAATGERLATVDVGRALFASPAALGDVDGDGVDEWAIGLAGADPAEDGEASYEVWIMSGRSHERLDRIRPETFASIESVAGIGDVDRDGVPDLLVGDAGHEVEGRAVGAVHVHSGATRRRLYSAVGSRLEADRRLGSSVLGLGDVDGDGVPDFAAGATGSAEGQGSVHVRSGADGALIARIDAPFGARVFGETLALLDDLDGDGRAELAVGVHSPWRIVIYRGGSWTKLRELDGASCASGRSDRGPTLFLANPLEPEESFRGWVRCVRVP